MPNASESDPFAPSRGGVFSEYSIPAARVCRRVLPLRTDVAPEMHSRSTAQARRGKPEPSSRSTHSPATRSTSLWKRENVFAISALVCRQIAVGQTKKFCVKLAVMFRSIRHQSREHIAVPIVRDKFLRKKLLIRIDEGEEYFARPLAARCATALNPRITDRRDAASVYRAYGSQGAGGAGVSISGVSRRASSCTRRSK